MFVKTPACELLNIKLQDKASGSELYSEVERLSGISAKDCSILKEGKWPVCLFVRRKCNNLTIGADCIADF